METIILSSEGKLELKTTRQAGQSFTDKYARLSIKSVHGSHGIYTHKMKN